ncbi:glucose 1-dehydrogenase [Nocardia sp. R6R-6]|uniref:glucose 1-dehydrogenase n=1 Tax=Nocardia sp. R6R-6 TaxID=3459303 RepID=UPI00403DBA69
MALEGLQGKSAVVTAGAQGIGAAVAERLVGEGARVAIVDIDADRVRAFAESLGDSAIAIAGDASTPEGVETYLAQAVEAFGRVDLAHLNVGIGNKPHFVADSEIDDFDKVMNVNLRGAYLGLRGVLKRFLAQGGGGSVVMTSSINGIGGTPGSTIYTASKHGIIGLVRSAAREYGPQGVRINAIVPGFVETKALLDLLDSDGRGAERRAEMESTVPLGRWARPSEIAAAISWLLSDEASFVSGSAMVVDGAATAGATAWERFTSE